MLLNLNSPWEHPVKQILNTEAELYSLLTPGERRILGGGILAHDRTQLILKTFPQLFTVTLKVTDCCLKILFLSPNLFHATHSCQKLQGKQRTSRVPYGNGLLWVETLFFLIPPNKQLDTFIASQQRNSLHNKEEAANRNKRLLEIQEKNLSW